MHCITWYVIRRINRKGNGVSVVCIVGFVVFVVHVRNYLKFMVSGTKGFIEAISTGALNLDAAIGIGGLPRGRMSEIYGPESSGKTTLTLHVVANAQRKGGIVARRPLPCASAAGSDHRSLQLAFWGTTVICRKV